MNLRITGENSVDVAINYYNIGNSCCQLGELEEASEMLEKAGEINGQLEHVNAELDANLTELMGEVACENGNIEEGLLLYQESVLKFKGLYGKINKHVARIYNNMANISLDEGNLAEAITYLNDALYIAEQTEGTDSIYTGSIHK